MWLVESRIQECEITALRVLLPNPEPSSAVKRVAISEWKHQDTAQGNEDDSSPNGPLPHWREAPIHQGSAAESHRRHYCLEETRFFFLRREFHCPTRKPAKTCTNSEIYLWCSGNNMVESPTECVPDSAIAVTSVTFAFGASRRRSTLGRISSTNCEPCQPSPKSDHGIWRFGINETKSG